MSYKNLTIVLSVLANLAFLFVVLFDRNNLQNVIIFGVCMISIDIAYATEQIIDAVRVYITLTLEDGDIERLQNGEELS